MRENQKFKKPSETYSYLEKIPKSRESEFVIESK